MRLSTILRKPRKKVYFDISIVKLPSEWRAFCSFSIHGRALPSTYITFIFPISEREEQELVASAPAIANFVKNFVYNLWQNSQIPISVRNRRMISGLVCTAYLNLLKLVKNIPQEGKITVRFPARHILLPSPEHAIELPCVDLGVFERVLITTILLD